MLSKNRNQRFKCNCIRVRNSGEMAPIFEKFGKIRISHSVGSFVTNVFLLGDPKADKTTLTQELLASSTLALLRKSSLLLLVRYVVKEVLDEVHKEINANTITDKVFMRPCRSSWLLGGEYMN